MSTGGAAALVLLVFLWRPVQGGGNDCAGCETPNVRTVLFRQTDLMKECWSDEELALLYARRLTQELIPRRATCNVPLLLDYLVIVLGTAKSLICSARAHRLLMMAIADAFGGYLQAYGLPQIYAKYYEGSGVSYCTTHQIQDVQKEFKKLLSTDGGGWTRSVFVRRSSCNSCSPTFKLNPVDRALCSNLVSAIEPGQCSKASDHHVHADSSVLLPFLDDPHEPRAIAVPFKDHSLYSLSSRNSSDILLRYYSLALTCIGPPGEEACTEPIYQEKIDRFVIAYHAWLVKNVLPRLHDEHWYPGFGGVYSILKEMETRGLMTQDVAYDESCSDNFAIKQNDICEAVAPGMWSNMWIVLCVFLIFWIIVCNLCCLLKYCSRNNENECVYSPTSSSSGAVINSLVTMYCCENEQMDGKLNQ